MKRSIIPALSAMLLAGCAVGPDYVKPNVATPAAYKEATPDAPKGWKVAQPREGEASSPWWLVYNDKRLDELTSQVEVSNQSLIGAEAAYRQSLAAVKQARASFFPTLTAGGGATRSGRGRAAGGGVSNNFTASAGVSWEPDVWGRIRRTVEGNVASAQASAADLAMARLSLQAQLVTNYFALRYQDDLKRLLDQTVAQYRQSLTIAQNQFNAGIVGESDVISAQTQLREAESQAIGAGLQRAQLEHAIAVLIGQPPAALAIAPAGRTTPLPAIPAGIPSRLLERRPDIAAAERDVAASSADIGVATAAFFPDITLTGSYGYASALLPKLIQAPSSVWSYGPQIAATVLDFGARQAQVEAARAAHEQAVANYRQTVLTAFKEVEDQLSALKILARQARVQEEAVTLARRAVELTLSQYQAGTVPFTSVITAQTTALNTARQALAIRADRLAASVALMQALGGGWSQEKLPTPAAIIAASGG